MAYNIHDSMNNWNVADIQKRLPSFSGRIKKWRDTGKLIDEERLIYEFCPINSLIKICLTNHPPRPSATA
jgi:hypothetical protein